MPKRCDLKTICVLGSGPVIIGQAAEFDYSGTQAVKALKSEGFRVVLINSNPASIMTGIDLADQTYIEPLTLSYVTPILEKERPCAILPTVGGQTALNLAVELHQKGILKQLNIELIGADIDAILRAEDREAFKNLMIEVGLPVLRSRICHNLKDAENAILEFGLPIIIRPSFTLGGAGGGIGYTKEETMTLVENGLYESPCHQVLLEESVIGHKEYEFEVIRDGDDNAVIVCSIENFDAMGVHTGDSITVAPAQTLSDTEYQTLRDASIQVLRAVGVKTGGSNVQFSVDPKNGRFAVIEMNPRVSRSSALASKATGYPIAKVAALLAVGYRLDEIVNDITKKTTAAFEPALDYVVVKIPRFSFEKFFGEDPELSTQMRSVGEVMAIGRSFKESLQKAMAALEEGISGFDRGLTADGLDSKPLLEYLAKPTPRRLWRIAQALERGYSVDEVAQASKIDRWFLHQINEILDMEKILGRMQLKEISPKVWRDIKMAGLLDERIAKILGVSETDVRKTRLMHGVKPVYKRVDSCAAEFEAVTPYMYSTYEQPYFQLLNGHLQPIHDCEAMPTNNKKVIVLGSGPIRIGQGIEFDCCSTESIAGLRSLGLETIMINCNPETVSTDFDSADRLYFEPLTFEHVQNICDLEKPYGVIVQLGGQTPLALAKRLHEAGITILGTQFVDIDRAEDRQKCRTVLEELGLRQAPSETVMSLPEALLATKKIGYPVMVRPSYVLGGRAMKRIHKDKELIEYLALAMDAGPQKPILIDRFLDGAMELDVDAISDGTSVYVAAILQHIEEAGIHSGDSACVLPPFDLEPELFTEIEEATHALCQSLNIVGLINIQFAVKDGLLYVIEANPRASRTLPFIAKATNVPLAAIASMVMCGEPLPAHLAHQNFVNFLPPNIVAIKAPVIPFAKFPKSDPMLGPEMRSTGEVMAFSSSFEEAFLKSQIASGICWPRSGKLFVSIADHDKERLLPAIRLMQAQGFEILATSGTHWFLTAHQIASTKVNKVREGSPHVLEMLESGEIKLMWNTILGSTSVADSHLFRKKALMKKVPYVTSVFACMALARAITGLKENPHPHISSLQEYHKFKEYQQ
jgi:carbamoyl-phosphate synthase large subunit